MFNKGKALLLWALECKSEMKAEFSEWYSLEHVPALVQVSGFISGNRYVKVKDIPLPSLKPMPDLPIWLSFYELEDEKVLKSEEYQINRNSLGPGMRPEWTKRMLKYLSRIMGGTYEPLTEAWLAESELCEQTVWAIYLWPVDGKESAVDLWYQERLLPSLQSTGIVTACRLFGTHGVSPNLESKVRRAEGPGRIILTTVCGDSVDSALIHDTWAAIKDEIVSATSGLYNRMHL